MNIQTWRHRRTRKLESKRNNFGTAFNCKLARTDPDHIHCFWFEVVEPSAFQLPSAFFPLVRLRECSMLLPDLTW